MLIRISTFFAAVLALVPSLPALSVEPVLVDRFEAGRVGWIATRFDGQSAIHRLVVDADAARRGKTGILVETTTSDVGLVNLEYDVGQAPIIRELSAGVWIRGDRPGVQLTARIVLPRSIDPKDGLPVEFLAYGESYDDVGRWQRLTIDDFVRKTARRARKLRLDFGPTLDERGAYVDRVVLRIRPGRGRTKYAIDDLSVNGHLVVRPPDHSDLVAEPIGVNMRLFPDQQRRLSPAHRDRHVFPSEFTTIDPIGRDLQSPPRVVLQGSILLVDDRPFFPRIVEHAGEPFAELRKLGFNTVSLPQLATTAQLALAREAGLWVVCPPPPIEQLAQRAIAGGWDVILAWHLGSSLTPTDLPLLERQSAALNRFDPWPGRPIVGHVAAGRRALGRALDVVLVDASNGPRQPVKAELNSLIRKQQEATPGTPYWIIVPTHPPAAIIEQVRLLTERAGEPHRPFGHDAGTMERLALLGVAAGGRGLFFLSPGGGERSARRPLELELINLTLAPLDRLLAESQIVPSGSRFSAGSTYSLLRSSGQVLIRFSDNPQLVRHRQSPHEVRPTTRMMLIPGVPETSSVFRWTPAGMEPLPHRRVAGGVRVDLGEPRNNDLLLLMRDRKMISALAQRASASSRRALQLSGNLAALQIAEVRQTHRQLVPGSASGGDSPIVVAADRKIAAAAILARQGDLARAFGATTAVREKLGAAVRSDDDAGESQSADTAPWSGYWSSPRLDTVMRRLVSSATSTNTLVHGRFDDLAESHRAGWRHFQSSTSSARANVEIAHSAARQGTGCLHLSVKLPAESPDNSGLPINSSPIWITSPALPIASGDLFRVRGWVRVAPAGTGGSLDIVDSVGGSSIGVRVGATNAWQPFEFYRIAPRAELMHVTFSVRGIADVWLDDVRIEHLVLPPSRGANTDRTDLFAPPTQTQ